MTEIVEKDVKSQAIHPSMSQNGKVWFYNAVICPNANGMANSVDPDQTAPLGAV